VETYLASFASTADDFAARLDQCPGSWQMLPIQGGKSRGRPKCSSGRWP
jgi:hypothetical protein